MAYRTFTAKASYTKTKKAPKAKCTENQGFVDQLFEKREAVDSRNYGATLGRAMDGIAKHPTPVTTYEEALAVAGVGPRIAHMLCPQNSQESFSLSQSSTDSSKRKKRSNHPSTTSTRSGTQTTLDTIPEQSTKEKAYQKALKVADNWKGKRLTWSVVLLIDQRERQSEHITAKCKMSGIPCEVRTLPIGDMAWIAQGMDKEGKIQAQLLLGTIIERKTTEDLKASLFGTRYNEQQLRLQNSGMPQVIFLIEGDLNADLFRCPAETLHSTVWTIRLHKGFSILQTTHMDDTVKTLKRIHRRILQRTFPSAFYQESLPTFAEVDASGRRRSSVEGTTRKRRRHRLKSLMEMKFDVDPVPMQGYERFVSYAELKARVELDREKGTRSVANLHAAMLKQVATVSERKVQAILRSYTTPSQLLSAYDEEEDENSKKLMLSNIELNEDGEETTEKRSRVGPRSSVELFVAYCMTGEVQSDTGSSAVASDNTYRRLSEEVLREQLKSLPPSESKPASPVARAQPQRSVEESPGDAFWESLHAQLQKPQKPKTGDYLLDLSFSDSDDEADMNKKPAAISRVEVNDTPVLRNVNRNIAKSSMNSPICLDSPDPVERRPLKRNKAPPASPEVIVLE